MNYLSQPYGETVQINLCVSSLSKKTLYKQLAYVLAVLRVQKPLSASTHNITKMLFPVFYSTCMQYTATGNTKWINTSRTVWLPIRIYTLIQTVNIYCVIYWAKQWQKYASKTEGKLWGMLGHLCYHHIASSYTFMSFIGGEMWGQFGGTTI